MILVSDLRQISFLNELWHPRDKIAPDSNLHFKCLSASLPFAAKTARHYRELEAAIDVVEAASKLCVEVQTALQSSATGILEKNDQTPVTVADFSVQTLISLELGRRFPSISMVAEEDSASVRTRNLVEPVVNLVVEKAGVGEEPLTVEDVLEADRRLLLSELNRRRIG